MLEGADPERIEKQRKIMAREQLMAPLQSQWDLPAKASKKKRQKVDDQTHSPMDYHAIILGLNLEKDALSVENTALKNENCRLTEENILLQESLKIELTTRHILNAENQTLLMERNYHMKTLQTLQTLLNERCAVPPQPADPLPIIPALIISRDSRGQTCSPQPLPPQVEIPYSAENWPAYQPF